MQILSDFFCKSKTRGLTKMVNKTNAKETPCRTCVSHEYVKVNMV